MILDNHILNRARVKIELTAPMMIATGQANNQLDNDIVRDENGWPMIPGTSIAGALRELVARSNRDLTSVFGRATSEESMLSDLLISCGLVHNQDDRVMEAHKSEVDDAVLNLLAETAPVQRNGVAIDIYGVAKGGAKFDKTMVPKGTRFTFELSLWSSTQMSDQWHEIVALFCHPLFHLGGGRTSGQGTFDVVKVETCSLDLTLNDQIKQFKALPKTLTKAMPDARTMDIDELKNKALKLIASDAHTMRLKPENGWRIGGGSASLSGAAKASDILPYTEFTIKWANDVATLKPHTLVLPGSSVKGAFSHRMEFHYRRLVQIWHEKDESYDYRDTDIKHLFGWADDTSSKRGFIHFYNSYVEDKYQAKSRTRNKIDRLTGGTIDKALFSEERIYLDEISVKIVIDPAFSEQMDEKTIRDLNQAFELTLRDLKSGRLALGAGQNNGCGYFYEVN
ncbi:RAMP superfamily CRISPR-associated protein [Alteromonas ponticola]|uniref:RAMP superfamily CRISPR-associated protein n=1 Tax=Alteromonas aquimaris TaxID=2998417 RepID=A0ABT3PAN8_9ALTE|nr:RAMP superfamily CRISPR-associated protein [Alteromonas aquimaris]MCW8109605.1 RAMP superfamily CRISPR-associated protein [Alteromonas aquimaris]